MSDPKEPNIPENVPVLEIVDICGRPIPNENPSPGVNDANYQNSYFEAPDYAEDADEED